MRDILALDIDAGASLPPDTKSANFDNIADTQLLSPTLMNGYLRAAGDVSRLAVGDTAGGPNETTYKVTRWVSQREQVEGVGVVLLDERQRELERAAQPVPATRGRVETRWGIKGVSGRWEQKVRVAARTGRRPPRRRARRRRTGAR